MFFDESDCHEKHLLPEVIARAISKLTIITFQRWKESKFPFFKKKSLSSSQLIDKIAELTNVQSVPYKEVHIKTPEHVEIPETVTSPDDRYLIN